MKISYSALLFAGLVSSGAFAQEQGQQHAAPLDLPPQTSAPAAEENVDALEKALADLHSQDEGVWRAAERKLARLWSKSGSDSMDLLLKRGQDAIEREDWDQAKRHLTDLVTLEPNFAEGWSARAHAHFGAGDFGYALADLGHTLALEPRHFGALSGLGGLMLQLGREKEALEAMRAALKVHPNLAGAKEIVETLIPKVEGVDI